jgi:hypothetical protein
MKRITKKFLESSKEVLQSEVNSLTRLKKHLLELDKKPSMKNRYSSKINTIENQINKINVVLRGE